MNNDIQERVRKVISKTLSCDIDKVVDQASLMNDLAADSLDLAELTMAMQDEFGIEIADDQMTHIKTVKDVLNIVQQSGVA